MQPGIDCYKLALSEVSELKFIPFILVNCLLRNYSELWTSLFVLHHIYLLITKQHWSIYTYNSQLTSENMHNLHINMDVTQN